MTRLGLSLAALLAAAPLHAQDLAAQPFDPRAATCQTWTAAKPQPGAPSLSWVMDFIAAHDREPERDYYGGGIDLTDGVDAGEITAWMNGYCAAHPRDSLAVAAAALVSDLSARWVASHARQDGR